MKLFAIIMLASLFCCAGEVRITSKVYVVKKYPDGRVKTANSVVVHNRARGSIKVYITMLALERSGLGYKCVSSDIEAATIAKRDNKSTSLEATGQKGSRWSWLVLVTQNGNIIAHQWKYQSKKLDPKLFIGAKVGDIIKRADKNDNAREAQPL